MHRQQLNILLYWQSPILNIVYFLVSFELCETCGECDGVTAGVEHGVTSGVAGHDLPAPPNFSTKRSGPP